MKKIIFFIVLIYFSFCVNAQQDNIDSLQNNLNKQLSPSERFTNYRKIFFYYHQKGMIDSLPNYTKSMLELAQLLQSDSLLLETYGSLGTYFSDLSDYNLSLPYYFKALHLAEKHSYAQKIGQMEHNIGVV